MKMKIEPENIKMADFTYNLPNLKIASYPLGERDNSKLLIYNNGKISHQNFSDLPNILPEFSLMVRNNTKVIQARIEFTKETGAHIEIFCLEPADPPDYESNLSKLISTKWYCLIGNAKKWKSGILTKKIKFDSGQLVLNAERIGLNDGKEVVKFSWSPESYSFSEILDRLGTTPIPPYLERQAEPSDKLRYQTLYALTDGSVAAPTAGLHFTQNTEDGLKLNKIKISELTLHVGAGTFTPVKSERIDQHNMHNEHITLSKDTLHHLLNYESHGITAIGTTTLRTLESLYWLGHKLKSEGIELKDNIHIDQWLPYNDTFDMPVREALLEILMQMTLKEIENINFNTSLLIIPGYSFKLVNRLITNFHQPGSTLLLLVAAFIGEDWRNVYNYALENDFRFLSYGDSSLLLRNQNV